VTNKEPAKCPDEGATIHITSKGRFLEDSNSNTMVKIELDQ